MLETWVRIMSEVGVLVKKKSLTPQCQPPSVISLTFSVVCLIVECTTRGRKNN